MEPVASGLTYDDLAALPDDGMRHELIHGEHFVSPAPILRHQAVVLRLAATALAWADGNDGHAFVAPTDVVLATTTVLQPDVVVIGPEGAAAMADPRYIDVVPDLVVEVSSPSTRGYDLVRKRRAYEEFGVPEYWFVDLDAERLERYVVAGGTYATPEIIESGEVRSTALAGLVVDLAELLDA